MKMANLKSATLSQPQAPVQSSQESRKHGSRKTLPKTKTCSMQTWTHAGLKNKTQDDFQMKHIKNSKFDCQAVLFIKNILQT